jgi:hypothetical protein
LPARTVFHLVTPYTPPRSRPALFRAGGALGVAPSRALILPEIRTPLGAGYPLVVSFSTRSVSPAGARPIRASAPTGGDGGREVPAPRRSLRTGVGGMKPLSSAEPLPRRSTWRHPKVTPHVSPRARVNAARFPDPRPGRPPGCLWRGDAPRRVVTSHVHGIEWPFGHAMQFGVSPRARQRATTILSDRDREAPPDPTLPSGPVLVRPKPNKGPGGGSTTATLVE